MGEGEEEERIRLKWSGTGEELVLGGVGSIVFISQQGPV